MALALGVLVVVVGSGLARVLQTGDPARAAELWSWNAAAPAILGEQAIVARPDVASAKQASAFARRALSLDASQALAYAVLGLAADVAHDPSARRLMLTSDRFSRRIFLPRLWLIEDAVRRGDVDGALHHFDIGLRTSHQAPDILFPVLIGAASDPNVTGKLAALLRSQPLWRDAFLAALVKDADPMVAWRLIAANVGPLPDAVRRTLVLRLVATGRPDLAFTLAGGREGEDVIDLAHESGRMLPFAWDVISTDATDAVRENGTVTASTRSSTPQTAVERLAALSPGRYAMTTTGTVQSASGRGSVRWTATCTAGQGLVALPLGHSAQTTFTVPAGCHFQWLRLEMATAPGDDDVGAVVSSYRVRPLPSDPGI